MFISVVGEFVLPAVRTAKGRPYKFYRKITPYRFR